MPVIYAKAPGKIILFGEHAVVYDQPAIAIPVTKVNATVRVFPDLEAKPGTVHIQAPDIQLDTLLSNLPDDDPIAIAVQRTFESIQVTQIPACTLKITSTIPIAAGMGSSAAISIAIIRAVSGFLGKPLPPDEVSALTYEVEKIHHGTPSGIDNSVIAYQKPIFFQRSGSTQFLDVERPTHWVIADSGEKTLTRETVSDVREKFEADRDNFDLVFKQIGKITADAREALINADLVLLGNLINENQSLLEQLGVSSQGLERLIHAARMAGAPGAKLSGGGRGGNIIALSPSGDTGEIEAALIDAGAQRVITTTLTKGRL